ncbi:MAG: amidase family protein [Cyanobacteria bacterium P01_A01_bin.37]
MFREATQGEKDLRNFSNLSQLLPTLLNPKLKDYFEALTERDRFIVKMDQDLKPWDVWLCPISATPAFTHRPTGTAVEIDGRKVPYILASGGYTLPFAFTGHPVVVIPVGQTQAGLPIGIQIVGKRWQEIELLAIAQEIDRVVDRFQRPPDY